jgi:putative oxidoreductase
MAFEATGAGEALLVGRVLFAGVLAFLAVGNLQELEETVAYAESKGAPFPALSVPLSSLALIAGALSIAVGAAPLLGSLAVLGFVAGVTPVMHDFWNQEGMDRQNEQIHFLKNVGIAGGAFVFAALSTVAWPYAVGVSLV